MATMASFDMPIPPSAAALFGGMASDGEEYARCVRCSFGGCDVGVQGCGCSFHSRCIPLKREGAWTHCSQCNRPTSGLVLFSMSFREIDEAKKTASVLAANARRARKRKSIEISQLEKGSYVSERRTGRWTDEEMSYCDKLIAKFETGQLPITEGLKLNEFLGSMLKSKQSRLTKKMKNAKLSSKTFKRIFGFFNDVNEAREFSALEDSFFHSIQCHQDRAEMRFHMQKEWREMFSNVCVSIGQPLDVDNWLSSVEEMDRRASQAKDAARMARRKLMMGFALRTDAKNPGQGVFIERTDSEKETADETAAAAVLGADASDSEEILSLLVEKSVTESKTRTDTAGKSSLLHSAPFLSKAISYMQRHNIVFEHIGLWVPSFVPSPDDGSTTCRLCYAGSATVDYKVGPEGKSNVALSGEEHFMLQAFGDYSQKFSFDVGCGLPGRVYQSGLPTWEQSVQNAPHRHFERCGGARQWGIKTVVGIPISSPNVGRIVVTLYSREDREKNHDLVSRLSNEFNRMLPSPKWKLVVDVGEPEIDDPIVAELSAAQKGNSTNSCTSSPSSNFATMQREHQDIAPIQQTAAAAAAPSDETPQSEKQIEQVVSLLGEFMPSHPNSQYASFLPGFMSLRLMLLRQSKTHEEQEQMRIVLGSYSSYSATFRSKGEIAVMLARDYMLLTQHPQQHPQQHQPQYQQHQHDHHQHDHHQHHPQQHYHLQDHQQHQQLQYHQHQHHQRSRQHSNPAMSMNRPPLPQHQHHQHQSLLQAQLPPPPPPPPMPNQAPVPAHNYYGMPAQNGNGANGNFRGSASLPSLPIADRGTDTVSIVSN